MYLRIYIKAFISSSILWLILSLINLFDTGSIFPRHYQSFVVYIILILLEITWSFEGSYRHIKLVGRLPYGVSNETLSTTHQRYFTVLNDYTYVYNLCLQTIKLFDKYKIKNQNIEKGIIIFREFGFKSLSYNHTNVIIIKVRKLERDKTQIELVTRINHPFIWFDFGENLQNIENLLSYLKDNCKVEQSSAELVT